MTIIFSRITKFEIKERLIIVASLGTTATADDNPQEMKLMELLNNFKL